jgi:hypothetical protein
MNRFTPAFQRVSLTRLLCVVTVLSSSLAGNAIAAQPEPRPSAGQAKSALSLEELRQARREAAQRPRRVIFNNDGTDAISRPRGVDNENSIEGFLRASTTGLIDSHVDTIAYNTNTGGFGLFFHDTKVGEVFTSRDRRPNNLTGTFIDQGTDPLRVMTEFARKHGKEVFWSMRMNNTHDNKFVELFPRFKRENPGLLMGTAEKPPLRGSWSAVDFGHEKVRDFVCRMVEEVCRNYDVDGVQLDFLRFPILFRSTANRESTTLAERESLTEMMRRIRQITEQVGVERGQPLLVSVRTPDSPDYCKEVVGIDLEQWLKEGLVDLLFVGGDVQMKPWTESLEFGRRFGVPVYPSFREGSGTAPMKAVRNQPAGWRGTALAAFASGAEGIEVFNLMHSFAPEHAIYREIGDPAIMRRRDRSYAVTRNAPSGLKSWLGIDGSHFGMNVLSPNYSRPLGLNQPTGLDIWLGESEPTTIQEAQVRLLIAGATAAGAVKVTVNDVAAVPKPNDQEWLRFSVEPAALKAGKNRIVVESTASGELTLQDLVVDVTAQGSPGQ